MYVTTQMEWPIPSSIYTLEVKQDQATGLFSAVDTFALDWSHEGGAWITCAGSMSTWGGSSVTEAVRHRGAQQDAPHRQQRLVPHLLCRACFG